MEGDSQHDGRTLRRPKSSPTVRDDNNSPTSRRPATAASSHTHRTIIPLTSLGSKEEAAPHDIQSASRSTVSLRSDSSDLLHDGGVRTRFDDVTEFEQRLSTLHRVEEEPPPYTAGDYSYIQDLLELTEGETDFESDKEIPDIFAKAEQLQRYSDISQLKNGLKDEEEQPYLNKFGSNFKDDALMVGKLSIEQIEAEEQRLQTEYLEFQEEEAARHRKLQVQITTSEDRAKKEVKKTLRRRERAAKKKVGRAVQTSMTTRKGVYKSFHVAEQQMLAALNARKGEVKLIYGHLERADGYYGAVKGRRWKVDWTRTPQPVQIKIHTLRGVGDKLPASRYVLLVSLYDRLGGHVLRWSKLRGQEWGAVTLPLDHGGHYYNTDMKFDQSVFTVLPSKPDVRPSMVLIFELFVLRGAATPTDCVVGWGAFPVCDANFDIIEGKYKCPLLRGSVNPLVTKYSKIEKMVATDLENWLSNLYFEVIKLPRYLQGMHEYEVELQFSSGLLGQVDRTHDERDVVDGNEPMLGPGDVTTSELVAIPSSNYGTDASFNTPMKSIPPHHHNSTPTHPHTSTAMPVTSSAIEQTLQSRPSNQQTISGYTSGTESSSSSDMDDINSDNQREKDFIAVQDRPGLYYKVHQTNHQEDRLKLIQTMYPSTPLLRSRRKKRRQKNADRASLDELEKHSIAVSPPFSEKGRVKHRIQERLQYVGRQFLSEMGLSQWKSLEFWSMVVILLLSWWVRLYLHYIAQYGFLRAIAVPVTRFEFYPHTVVLNYQSTLPLTREEAGLVVLGPLFNTFVFSILVFFSWTVQRLFGGFPDLGSLFIAAFGIQVLLEPYWVASVDIILLRFRAPQPDLQTADVTKLYWHFVRLENNGVVGIFLTLYLYLLTTVTTLAVFYMYFLRVHMNGRLIDVYQRLKSSEEKLFFPQDMEISIEELSYICRKAEQWRGAEGERRKVAVYDYLCETDEVDEGVQRTEKSARERTSHLSIHTLHLDGLRELYRHFLRLDNGAVIEIFGEVSSVPGVSAGVKNALLNQRSKKTAFSTSQPSLSNQPFQSTPIKKPSFDEEQRLSPIPGRSERGTPEADFDENTLHEKFLNPYNSFNISKPEQSTENGPFPSVPGPSTLGAPSETSAGLEASINLSISTALDFGDWDDDSVFERRESSVAPLLPEEEETGSDSETSGKGKGKRGHRKLTDKNFGKQLSAGQLV